MAHPAIVNHLLRLGVTAVELLPVHHFLSEGFLDGIGLSNYWGYSTIGFFAPHSAYAADGPARRTGRGVQAARQDPAPCRDRGDPRRRLQPHQRGQRARSDPVVPRHRQRRVLSPARRRPQPVRRLHGHRQQPQRATPRRAPIGDGQPPVLGHRHARRRLPVRPRIDARPRRSRLRSQRGVLRSHPSGSRRQPGQADRRTVGRRPWRLPTRQLPAAVVRVECEVPGRHPGFLEGNACHPGGVCTSFHRKR